VDLERFATKADLERFATKADLEGFATKADLERFATKVDLERFATKEDLRQGIAEAKRHTDVLIESVRDDIRMLAEGVVAVAANLRSLTERLEEKGVI
jgi:glutaredoxin 2